jgi:hypothetical protein
MWKKFLLTALALGFVVVANMQLCCSLWIQGQKLEGSYAPQAVDRGMTAASAAAEEIISGSAQLPQIKLRYKLSFQPLISSSAAVSSAVLDSTQGVTQNYGVYVNDVYLGSVQSRDELYTAMSSFITNQLPSWADYGFLTQELTTKLQYSRVGSETPVDDMVLLISGMAPVMYANTQGYIAWA